MNNKKVYIIHRWGGDPKADWYVWLKNQLQDRGFEVYILEMPNPESPNIKKWTDFISQQAGEPNDNMLFIGHSIGCQAILRYLQESQASALGVVCVAGWFRLKDLETEEEKEIAKPWLDISLINFEKIKENAGDLIAIFSDNDPYVSLEENKKVFKEKLNAKIIIQKDKGHFTEEDGIVKLPVVLEEVLKISKIKI
ncbi:MAG: alpha/beta hydrolase [Patescibacteria group bacterium]|nr:alpha/beta hydrolase [Patescibacteria group bacterium]